MAEMSEWNSISKYQMCLVKQKCYFRKAMDNYHKSYDLHLALIAFQSLLESEQSSLPQYSPIPFQDDSTLE